MKIYAIEAYYSGSHKRWLDEYVKHSVHEITPVTMPGRHWKWRMEGAAITLSERLKSMEEPDAFLCTDMLNVALFKSLLPKSDIPIYLYMHENQISYPWSETDPDKSLGRDLHYAFINYTSCLVADKVFFNSKYHFDSFYNALSILLKRFPDGIEMSSVEKLRLKSEVIPISLDVKSYLPTTKIDKGYVPTFLWNHRWEFDKKPAVFFNALLELKQRGNVFKLIVLGEKTKSTPEVFSQMEGLLKEEIIHFGYVDSKEKYISLLQQADIALTTSIQDFFGISVVEAIAAGCIPLLPNRLAYPEHLDGKEYPELFYNQNDEIIPKLENLINANHSYDELPNQMMKYDWSHHPLKLDEAISKL